MSEIASTETFNIISELDSNPENISEEDLDWIVPKLLDHFDSKIRYWAKVAYSQHASQLSYRAFLEQVSTVFYDACRSFLFKHQHWRGGRSIAPYLIISLKFAAQKIQSNTSADKKVNILVCPACKSLGQRIYLLSDERGLHCGNCESEIERLESEKNLNEYLNNLLHLHRSFINHSKKGYKCPDCGRFIPDSHLESGCSCPFNDCSWFGSLKELLTVSHPATLGKKEIAISIQADRYKNSDDGDKAVTWEDSLSGNNIRPDTQLELEERFNREHKILNEVIDKQMRSLKYTKSVRAFQKKLMYQTYKNMLDEHPEEMISYLVHLNYNKETPIQCKIFQEFSRLVENNLPFSISKNGEEIDIFSLQDPNLNLFLGISEFDAKVDDEGFIPNNTSEHYFGGREFKNYGPCFIGKLISAHIDDVDITHEIQYYTFVKLKASSMVKPGSKVRIKHLRIYSHYEQGPLTILQRTRRKIVDSSFKRLHGKERDVRSKEDKSSSQIST